MSNITQGPWIWTELDEKTNKMPRLLGFNGVEVMNFGDNTTYYPSEGEPPAQPDALLIAASPDLLQALMEIMEVAERCDGWQSFPNAPVEKARLAICKALGVPN